MAENRKMPVIQTLLKYVVEGLLLVGITTFAALAWYVGTRIDRPEKETPTQSEGAAYISKSDWLRKLQAAYALCAVVLVAYFGVYMLAWEIVTDLYD